MIPDMKESKRQANQQNQIRITRITYDEKLNEKLHEKLNLKKLNEKVKISSDENKIN